MDEVDPKARGVRSLKRQGRDEPEVRVGEVHGTSFIEGGGGDIRVQQTRHGTTQRDAGMPKTYP